MSEAKPRAPRGKGPAIIGLGPKSGYGWQGQTIDPRMERCLRMMPGYDPFKTAGDCRFDQAAAGRVIAFYHRHLTHVKGSMGGKPLILSPWQMGFVGNLYGWKRPNGRRRYTEFLGQVPRKNGKTPIAAGLVLVGLGYDGESGAEVYSGAGDIEQAALIYDWAKGMVQNDEMLAAQIRCIDSLKRLYHEISLSYYRSLSRESKTKHGQNAHVVIIDELHVQDNRELYDTLRTSTAARSQPIFGAITTADFLRESIANEVYEKACNVRDGVWEDPYFLPMIFEAKEEDDWTSEATWAKANPGLGVSVSVDYMRKACADAQLQPAKLNEFKRLHLNIRTQSDIAWISHEAWDACGEGWDLDALAGRPCLWGMDLSSSIDLSAVVLFFPWDGNAVLPFFFVPGENAVKREKNDGVPYRMWMEQGHIEFTPGNVIDTRYIERRICELAETYRLLDGGFDPTYAQDLSIRLSEEHGIESAPMRSNTYNLSGPSKKFEALVAGQQIRHGRNPVMAWNVTNAQLHIGNNGDVMPRKHSEKKRIDGLHALLNAMGRAIHHPEEPGGVFTGNRWIEF